MAFTNFVEVPKNASEFDTLLERHSFTVRERYLSSVKDNIAQADWESANAQCPTFLEALTDAIADRLYPSQAATFDSRSGETATARTGGLSVAGQDEIGDGGGQTFLPGLAKLLHSDGVHPGISTQHDAIFRLQLVVITARWLLKRLEKELGR